MLPAAATHGERVQTQCSVLLCIPWGKNATVQKVLPLLPLLLLPPHPVVQDALVTDTHTAVHLGAEADYISVGVFFEGLRCLSLARM